MSWSEDISSDGGDFDINDFMREHAPETLVRWPHDLIEDALTRIGLLVYTVETGPRGIWTITVARPGGQLTYGDRDELMRLVRPALKGIKVLRVRTELHVFPVGQRVGLSFLGDEFVPVLGLRYRRRTRRGKVIERREEFVPLLRGAA